MVEICLLGLIQVNAAVYVGNIHPHVTDTDLQQVFSTAGPLEGCKLIRKDKVYIGLQSEIGRHHAFSIIQATFCAQVFMC
ncbi:oligouridylate-binding protein 1-like [Humulus lupulus]|uniref:oligouridylate-binding protein 1-like n=1 Tax=Humulus lupulus TaxID=3486 RepID=UPI002B4073F1|nr:oligouridylate-binding protein 1-like [Humulus lupulus]XP_062120615.1 oligouridylate-binding protein 1-like [Humulus lupulus]XP_062120617.1 oligouridylate-binding protein 1-like [Humulus lupulus]XP_062120618.1 oligouridylate-binding protein 1-like [Humulus lupulus]